MKKSILLFICLTLRFSQAKSHSEKKPKFRVVGYYSLKAAMSADLKTVPFDKLTHINLSFLNPDTLGNFNQDLSALGPFIKAAHKHHVKVLPSIAGGGKHDYYHKLLKEDNRAKFINDLLLIALKYNFDGIDVDIEGSDIDENYENFVVGLANVLRPHEKLLTSAIAIFYKDQLSDRALAQYDFMTLMSYDHTGPWRPSKPGPHSSYEHALADLDYFRTVRNIPKEKIVLGIGFYGYGFGPELTSKASSMNYGQIVKTFPGAEKTDQITMPDGMIMYYNGEETIRKKTLLAKENASGIMIWQILGDTAGDRSLLSLINRIAYSK
ncbi:MAG: glycosyl hydrolase family 18 protein [Pedobacter sp.]|jgi:GH18 family chitinase